MNARRFRTLYSLALLLIDSALLVLTLYTAFKLRVQVDWPSEAVDMPSRFLPYTTSVLPAFVGSIVVFFFWLRLYHVPRATSRVDEFYAIVAGLSLGMLLFVAVIALTLKGVVDLSVPRVMIAYALLLSIPLITIGRWLLSSVRDLLRSRGTAVDRLLIVGTGETARLVAQKIKGSAYLGYNLLGVVAETGGEAEQPGEAFGQPVLGKIAELPELIDRYQPDEIIIALPPVSDAEILHVINICQRDRLSLKVFPDVYDIMAAGVTIDDLGGLPLMSVRDSAARSWRAAAKRMTDVLVGGLILILISPFLLLFALLVKFDSPGPVFFVQERMGLDGKLFPMVKFRSMRIDSEAKGPGWTVKDDPRITRLGRFIRKYSIDELPQFINVLLGDMSLVGPRPEQPSFVEQFRKMIPRYMERHREKAGLTGWAQVNGLRGDTSIEERTKYDLWYIENWSIWLDFKIILRTAFKVFFDRSAY
ncbi:MAG TPA: undecaprenyl-phosphate glucose phosphotransferase [Anaerolineales bacterium]|nr:undecaprenyl-phosphate glucose phosphotransferase [Anaerolineales bacterium]